MGAWCPTHSEELTMREVDQMQSVISSHRLPCIPELVWLPLHLSVLAFGVWGVVPHISNDTSTWSGVAAYSFQDHIHKEEGFNFRCKSKCLLYTRETWPRYFLKHSLNFNKLEISTSALQVIVRIRNLPKCPHIFQDFRVTISFNLHLK